MWRGNAYPAAILMAGMVLYGLWVSVSMTSPADYRELLTDDVFLESLAVSSYVAIVSTVLALIIGVVLARLLSRTRLAALLAIPLFIPHLGAAYLAILYLSDVPVIGPHEGNYFSVILTYLYKKFRSSFFISYRWSGVLIHVIKSSVRCSVCHRCAVFGMREVYFYLYRC